MKKHISLLGLVLFACFQHMACSRPTRTEAPVLLSESSSKLQQEKGEVLEAQKKGNSEADALQKKIEQLELEIQRNQQMSSSQRQSVEAELAALKQQKAELDATLKAQAEKQAKLEEELRKANAATNTSTANSSNGSSGFPFCGTNYYGVTFQCGQKTCAKSDPNYQNICELTPNSRPATGSSQNTAPNKGLSGYPYCGSIYYGSEFNCNGQRCGKSDPNYQNICEITTGSSAANSGGTNTLGASGYPYCPATTYGSVFDCNGKKCSKSDPAYQNICELR